MREGRLLPPKVAGAEAYRRMGGAGAAQGRGARWPSDAALVRGCRGGKRGGEAGAGARPGAPGWKEPEDDRDSDYSAVVVMLLPFHDVQSAGETGSPRQICEISSENTSPLTDSELLKRAKII